MGATPFPVSLYARVHPDGYEADDEDDVTTQTARDLSEQRLYNGTVWRSSFRLVLRSAAERTTLRDFKAARYTGFDSFPFTAPDDSVTRQVKFVECSGRHIGRQVWEYRIVLQEVP